VRWDIQFFQIAIVQCVGVALALALAGCRSVGNGFYPIGIYGSDSAAEMPDIRAAGFNLVTGAADDAWLDNAQKNSLHVLASPGTAAGPTFEPLKARDRIREHDSHPALWGWYLIDEPDLHRVPAEQVRQAHRFFKRAGARKPTVVVLYKGNEAGNYGKIADITMVDRYPIPWLPLADFPKHMHMARLALGPDEPMIAIIQAFDWSAWPNLVPGEKNLRPPTERELRCMTYCALARGANGLFYYTYSSGKWKIREHPEIWEPLKRVVAEVNSRMPLFQARRVWWPKNHYFANRDLRFNEALEASVLSVQLRVQKGGAKTPAGDYILAVNTTPWAHTYQFTLPWKTGSTVAVLGENRDLVIDGEWAVDQFGPYDVHVYGPIPGKGKSE